MKSEAKLEMGVRVKVDGITQPQAVVRKVIIGEDGEVIKKYALDNHAKWIEMPAGVKVPDECLLPAEVFKVTIPGFDVKPEEVFTEPKPKCLLCHGSGVMEREGGLVAFDCPMCKGTGEFVPPEESTMSEELKAAIKADKKVARKGESGDALDTGSGGDKPDDKPGGSEAASEPAKPRKSKTASKATKKPK